MESRAYNPDLPIIKPGYKGNLLINGRFTNSPWPDTEASFSKVFRWMLSSNPQKKEKKADNYIPEIIPANDIFTSQNDMISWLGHATFFIRAGGKNLLIDPITGDIPFVKRRFAFPADMNSIKNIDYLLLSHAHRDHFDEPSLQKIIPQNPNTQLLGPLKIENLVTRIADKVKIQTSGWYQQFKTKGVTITFLPALHWHRRGLNDFNTVFWGSFMIEANGKKIYFSGDTAYGSHFKEIKEVMGKPDLCLLPIGAYKPQFLMQRSHTSPEEAIQAFFDLEGKKFIPMHYATYDLANEPIGEPIRIIRSKLDNKYLLELKPGEKFFL